MRNHSKRDASAPLPEDRTERPSLDLIDQLEGQDAIAEAADISAEFAIDIYLEAQQAAREVERPSKELGE